MLKLRKYQKEGFEKIEEFKGRALLADEMRLGKTPQVLYWLYKHPDLRPAIVVCPSTAKWEWRGQAWRHVRIKGQVLEGRTSYKIKRDLIIVNYDILSYWVEELRALKPKVIVMDECHFAKSRKAKRTKAIKQLAKKVPHVIAISGTPAVNRPAELFTTLNLLRKDLFPSFWRFAFRYCDPKKTPWGWDFSGSSNLDELYKILTENLMIRRLRKDVWDQLPKKQRKLILLDIIDRKEYKKAENDFIGWLSERDPEEGRKAERAKGLVKTTKLLQFVAELKLKQVIQWIEEFLEKTDDKLVVFGIHKNILKPLHARFQSISVLVDGSVRGRDRERARREFQKNEEVRLFFGNIISAGTAISLARASSLAFVELDFVPGNLTQAEDRVISYHKKEGGAFYYLVAKGTIEEKLCRLIQKKQKVLSSTLDGGSKVKSFSIYDALQRKLLKEI